MTIRKIWLLLILLPSVSVYGQYSTATSAGSPPFSLFGSDVSLSGSLSAEMQFYTISQLPDRRDPFSVRLHGSPVINIGSLSIPLQFLLGDYQVSYRESFNRIGLSSKFKWGSVHLGHRSVSLSPLAWGSHNFLGAGVEINAGKVRLGVLGGRLKRAIEPDSVTMTTYYDPAFTRMGMGAKLGYGTDENHIDLILLKASDKPESVEFDPIAENVHPAQNTVLAVNVKKSFDKKWFFNLDAGVSGWTDDMGTPPNEGNEKFLSKIMGILMQRHTSTYYAAALQTSIEYRKPTYSAKVLFDRIDPQYKTMGTYYFHDDIQRIRLSGSVRLLNNKITLMPELGWQENNLANNRSGSSARTIGSLRATYRHNMNWFFSAYMSNFQSKLKQETGPLTDSLIINQANKNLGGSISYRIPKGKSANTVNFSIAYLGTTDKTMDTANSILSNLTTRATYRMHLQKAGLYLTPGVIWSKYTTPFSTTTRLQPNIQANKTILNNRLNIGYNLGLIFASVNSVAATTVLRNSLDMQFKLNKKHNLTFRIMQLLNMPEIGVNYNELQGNLRYSYQL